MRIAPIITNETCDHRCAFCRARRSVERPSVAGSASIRARIDAALAAGAEELVLTGGEPTLRRDLPAIVAYAARRGARTILETNAATLDRTAALRLYRAGLHTARVHLPGWGPSVDTITGDRGGFSRTKAAIHGLLAAGIRVEANLPICRESAPHLLAIPRGIADSGLDIAMLWLVVVTATPATSSPLQSADATDLIARLHAAATALGIRTQLSPQVLLPPCLFAKPHRVADLYALSPGGRDRTDHRQQPACEACRAADRCPGVPTLLLAREPDLEVRPLTDDRMRRRLSVIAGVEAQIERELVTEEADRQLDGKLQRATTVRVQFRCNQACSFCFVSTHLPAATEDRVSAAIVAAAADGGIVVLSGGEPTLHPKIVDFVALARASGASSIELQTNAVRLATPGFAERLDAAGVDLAFVSLHGSVASTSDAITRAPGTFAKTLLGIDALHRAGIALRLNFVTCRTNFHELPGYIEMVAERWPRASVCISFVGPSTDLVPHSEELIPRYSEVMPTIAQAIALGLKLGVEISGFDSMCGIPLCLVPSRLAQFTQLPAIPEGLDRGEFIKGENCQRCALETRCFGLRRRYADLYGDSELCPLSADRVNSAGALQY
ncbi:MAG TPA: radical SAM protein [Nannocystis exedens]|nr:radical SAM protein [Nannocystis exedens]